MSIDKWTPLDRHGMRWASRYLFSKSKMSSKTLIKVLSGAGYKLDNFTLIQVCDVYERLKSTGTHRWDLNKDIIQKAIAIAEL